MNQGQRRCRTVVGLLLGYIAPLNNVVHWYMMSRVYTILLASEQKKYEYYWYVWKYMEICFLTTYIFCGINQTEQF